MSPRHFAPVSNLDTLKALVDKLMAEEKKVGFDVETGYSGVDRIKGAVDIDWDNQFMSGFSLTNSTSWARYVPVAHDHGNNLPEEKAWEIVQPVLETLPIVAHNAKFEKRNLRALDRKGRGPRIELNVHGDSMLMSYVLSDYPQHGLKYLTKEVFGYEQDEISSLFPGATAAAMKKMRFNVLELTQQVIDYACDDAVWTLALHDYWENKVLTQRGFMYDLEMQIMALVCDMEDAGHAVDWDAIRAAMTEGVPFLDHMVAAARTGLGQMADADLSDLNLNSSPQMRKVLYQDLGLPVTRMTKKGDPSTDKIALEALSRQYVPVKKILEAREVKNLVNRMKKWTTEYNFGHDDRVHANFNQVVVGSGRFSANDPAIQQLPKKWRWTTILNPAFKAKDDAHMAELRLRGQPGKHYWEGNYRDFLIAAPDTYLLGYDYSQIELRCLAGMSQEPALLEAFNNDEDVHTLTAAMMLGIEVSEVTDDLRAIGKTMNFALLYGMGEKSLGERLALTPERASQLYAQYFASFTRVTQWMNDMKHFGTSRGYIETHFGRRWTLWDLQSNNRAIQQKGIRLCVNGPVQGTAADYMKISMLRAKKALVEKGWWLTKVRLINNLHDALTFEADNDINPVELRAVLQPAVVWPLKNFPKIVADWELGQRWGSSTKWKDEAVEFIDGTWTVIKTESEEPVVDDSDPFAEDEAVREEGDEAFEEAARHVEDASPRIVMDVAFNEGRPLVVETKEMPNQETFGAFLDLLKAHPGNTLVTLKTPEGEVDLANYKTSLGPDDQGRVSMALHGASTYYQREEVDTEDLGEGLAL